MSSVQSFSASASVSQQATSYGYTDFNLSVAFPNEIAKPIKADFYIRVHRDYYFLVSPTATAYMDYNGVSKCEAASNRQDGTDKTETNDASAEITEYGKNDTTARIGVKSSLSSCTARAEGTITLYFTRYDFSAAAGTGIASASVSSATGFDGDSIVFTAVPAEGYRFERWSDGSTQNPRTVTVSGADQSLTAYGTGDETKNVIIRYGGAEISRESRTPPVAVSYGGTQIASLHAGDSMTLALVSEGMPQILSAPLLIGGKTVSDTNAEGKKWVFRQNIAVEIESAAPQTTLTNLFPTAAANATGGWGDFWPSESVAFDTAHGYTALRFTGTAADAEILAFLSASIRQEQGHIYYWRLYEYHEAAALNSLNADMYWPEAEPKMGPVPLGSAGAWNMLSNRVVRSNWASGNQRLRVDFDNAKTAGNVWYSRFLLIDLTAAYGAGSEPEKAWLDANVPFFTGQISI